MDTKLFCLIIILSGSMQHLFGQTDSTKSDSLMQIQIQNDLAASQVTQPQQRVSVSANPDIGVIGDFRGMYHSYGIKNFDAYLSEAEFSFKSVVDPYARADFYYSVSQDPVSGEFSGEIEEGFVTTTSLPAHLQLKAGRFKQMLGRVNTVHSHALQFINTPDAIVNFFGEEGLKGDGLSLSWLLPNHVFYQELTVETTQPVASGVFRRSGTNNFLYLAHLKNYWDLTDNASLELGLTGITGVNALNKRTNMAAADITYKWKPLRYNTYKSVTFQNEIFFNNEKIFFHTENTYGFYSLLNVQVGKRWFVSGRYDFTQFTFSKKAKLRSGTATLGWYATEFQKIEVEAKYTSMNTALPIGNYEKKFTSAGLRWIFVIGSHGAHKY